MTELLYRTDPYVAACTATVVGVDRQGVVLDRTLFYAAGGGQPGDTGLLRWSGGTAPVVDTVKGGTPKDASAEAVLHVLEDGAEPPPIGMVVEAELDWPRRHSHMRMHTALHLLCSLVEGDVTGGQITAEKGRLDFNLPGPVPDRDALSRSLAELVAANHPVTARWIDAAELAARPELVRTLAVKPPTEGGRVRLIQIGSDGTPVDLQPCGGTHVARTGEIGVLTVGKMESKGRQNRRITLRLS